jgi:hypothetical protein
MTQNRYYTNLSQVSYITNTGGILPSDETVTTNSQVNWPTQYPFAVRIEPGTNNEEVALVTGGLGTAASPYELYRGYDGTNPLTHASGAAIAPGFCELDFAEPQQHLNNSTPGAVHGLPANAWGGGTMQLLATVPYTSAVGTVISISTIPSTFNHLRLEYSLQGNGSSAGGILSYCDFLTMRFNGISGALYQGINSFVAQGAGSTFLTRQTSSTQGFWVGPIWIENPSTPGRGRGVIEIPAYADTTSIKSATSQGVASDGGVDFITMTAAGCLGTYTSPVASIQLQVWGSSTAFVAGDVWLYGIN